MEPLVSVIIPVYKTEEYLAQCVESVLEQTYPNLEIILVDDGSPDNCPALCDAYALQDLRVRVIHRENGGLSAARNSGIDAAKGDYLTFLDSDDRVSRDMVAEMVRLALQESVDIVKIGLIRCYNGVIPAAQIGKHRSLTGLQVLKNLYTSQPQLISACGKLFRRELFQSIRFPERRYFEDELTTPKLFAQAKQVVLSDSVMYFYMQWENESIMRSALTEKKLWDAAFVTEDRLAFFRQQAISCMIAPAIKDHYMKLQKLEQAATAQVGLEKAAAELTRMKKEFARKHLLAVAQVQSKQLASRLKHRLLGK